MSVFDGVIKCMPDSFYTYVHFEILFWYGVLKNKLLNIKENNVMEY